MTVKDFTDKSIENIISFIGGSNYKNFIDIIGGDSIPDVIDTLKEEASQLKSAESEESLNYQFTFALKRDAVNRYAPRSLLFKAGLDKKLYQNTLAQASALLGNKYLANNE